MVKNKVLKNLFKSMIASIVMGIVTKYVYTISSVYLGAGTIQDILTLSISIITGIVVYGVCIIVLKVEEMKIIIELLKTNIV